MFMLIRRSLLSYLHPHKIPRFFISYRRNDVPELAAGLYQALAARYPRSSIFLDVDTLVGGENFASRIAQSVKKSDCVIVIIGPRWCAVNQLTGQSRLYDENDFVRLEISLALKQKKKLIVVLYESPMAPPSQLPDLIRPIIGEARIDATNLSLLGLASRIQRRIKPKLSIRAPLFGVAACVAVWAILIPVVLALLGPHASAPSPNIKFMSYSNSPKISTKLPSRTIVVDAARYANQRYDLAAAVKRERERCGSVCQPEIFVIPDMNNRSALLLEIAGDLMRDRIDFFIFAGEIGRVPAITILDDAARGEIHELPNRIREKLSECGLKCGRHVLLVIAKSVSRNTINLLFDELETNGMSSSIFLLP